MLYTQLISTHGQRNPEFPNIVRNQRTTKILSFDDDRSVDYPSVLPVNNHTSELNLLLSDDTLRIDRFSSHEQKQRGSKTMS